MARKRAKSAAAAVELSGIELDGTRATVVTVAGDVTTAVRSFTADTGHQALREALSSLHPEEPVRICLASAAAVAARVDITPALSSRVALTREGLRLLRAPEGYAFSAVITDAEAVSVGRITTGLAIALPAEQVASAYDALESTSHPGEVVAVPAVACALEGLSLAVRGRMVDLCLVSGGQPLAYTVLQALGVESFISGLGGAQARTRVEEAMAGKSNDPLASAEVARWVESIAAEAAGVCATWRTSGLAVPDSVVVHGQGASTAGLGAALKRHALSLNQTDFVRMLGPVTSRPGARLEPIGALLSALSYSSFAPASVFVSRTHVAAAHSQAARRSRRAAAVTVASVLALLALPSLVPLSVAKLQAAFSAGQATSSAERISASVSGADLVDAAVTEYAASLLAPSADFASSATALVTNSRLQSVPGVQVTELAVSQKSPVQAPSAVVTLSVSGQDPAPAAKWMKLAATVWPQAEFSLTGFTASESGSLVRVLVQPESTQ